jgi:8-oxo-dGTP pyrophosphatase MutT (NUDIX family)
MEGEVLLMLRDDRSTPVYPNHWTLIGGNVRNDETPETAAARLLKEETGLEIPLFFWTQYDRAHSLFMIDQYVYTGKVEDSGNMLVLGPDTQFFNPCEIAHLRIGYGFKELLQSYLPIADR